MTPSTNAAMRNPMPTRLALCLPLAFQCDVSIPDVLPVAPIARQHGAAGPREPTGRWVTGGPKVGPTPA